MGSNLRPALIKLELRQLLSDTSSPHRRSELKKDRRSLVMLNNDL